MKRTNEPLFWALFGAGGMLAALLGPALVLITGFAAPLHLLPLGAMQYENVLAFARSLPCAGIILAVIALFLFHACHRMVHSLHDLGLPAGAGARVLFYGFATLASLAAAAMLLSLRA